MMCCVGFQMISFLTNFAAIVLKVARPKIVLVQLRVLLEKFEKSLNPAVRIQKLYHAKIEATTSWHTVYILFGKAAIREGSVKLDLYIK